LDSEFKMMRRMIKLIVLVVALFISNAASAAKGVVVYYKSGCDYYLVETSLRYALLEWYGGNDPNEGDILVGDFERYGMKEIYNLAADARNISMGRRVLAFKG
jgi:hypothetical protein